MADLCHCSACGVVIQTSTAAKNGGLCMPCKHGCREQVEAAKVEREAARRREQHAECQCTTAEANAWSSPIALCPGVIWVLTQVLRWVATAGR